MFRSVTVSGWVRAVGGWGGECGEGEGRGGWAGGGRKGGGGVQPPISPYQPTTLTHSLPPLPIVPFTPDLTSTKEGSKRRGGATPVPY